MAPVQCENSSVALHQLKGSPLPLHLFPDGPKTSGQHPPIYEQAKPFSEFPKEITGRTVWKAEDYTNNPEKWMHQFSEAEIAELSQAADTFLDARISLTVISKSNFPLPKLSSFLAELREDIINCRGFILFKGFPVEQWGNHKSAVAYMGLGTYLGYFVSQNGRGHVLGHVKDLGEDSTQTDRVRIYRTNARQFFHTDDGDIVGLLCIAKALEGGESDIVSTHQVYNGIAKTRPDVLETLTKPIWYIDRKGETSIGQEEYIRACIFYVEPKEDGRVFAKWDPYFVRSLTRFSDKGIIPPLSPAQLEALTVLEETCLRLALHMVLDVGDIQSLANSHILHARTEYKDYPPPAPRRHLMRLWLATPESEGGWSLPFWDTNEKKRGEFK
ncbi:taurine catabolism dioxygenase TauD [Paracoccidioides lutzii Pb01]|uniref:Taurine catabolism dioxygenase TauD n=1 Tax=Paracoccidioides lutzii (strain ATCC MYA-826 / Pb01) TaxID=502779 RepID=C1GRB2_PARBA|nr:taurine catabolism dioxygenase TauD [Paracoccidioides lutzii Pb01]EEH38136.2 taurine catabolism dioxygenase TauD [Paracoccidioides lutzii Pb01]